MQEEKKGCGRVSKKKVHELTDEEWERSIKEIERSMKSWPKNQGCSKSKTTYGSSGASLTPSFVLLMIELLMAVIIFKLLI